MGKNHIPTIYSMLNHPLSTHYLENPLHILHTLGILSGPDDQTTNIGQRVTIPFLQCMHAAVAAYLPPKPTWMFTYIHERFNDLGTYVGSGEYNFVGMPLHMCHVLSYSLYRMVSLHFMWPVRQVTLS